MHLTVTEELWLSLYMMTHILYYVMMIYNTWRVGIDQIISTNKSINKTQTPTLLPITKSDDDKEGNYQDYSIQCNSISLTSLRTVGIQEPFRKRSPTLLVNCLISENKQL